MNAPQNAASSPAGQGYPRSLAALVLVAVLAGGVTGCAPKKTGPPPTADRPMPEALVSAAGKPLTPASFDADVARADYILAGEEHPNPCDHQAQASLVRRLVKAGVRPAIGFEMIPVDRQDVLDAFHAGKLAVADLPKALDWKRTWGYPFALYAPIFEAAREADLPVYALNAPEGLARKVGRVGLGALPPAERAMLPGQIVPPDPAQMEQLREIFASHTAMFRALAAKADKPGGGSPAADHAGTGRDRFADFTTVQALWDTQLAQRAMLARARISRPVVVIAGGGHVERGWGIAKRLRLFDPTARVVTIMPWRGGEEPDAAEADLFYACPAMHKSRLGMTLSQEAPEPDKEHTGLLVTAVTPESPASQAGLLAGDALLAAGSHPADALAVLHTAAIEALTAGEPLRLRILRAGETITITIPLDVPRHGAKK